MDELTKPKSRTILTICIWLVAIGLSTLADRWVAEKVTSTGIAQFLRAERAFKPRPPRPAKDNRFKWTVADLLKFPGLYEFTVVVAVGAILAYKRSPRWAAGAFVMICGLSSGLNGPLKWIVGRARPYRELGSNHLTEELHPFKLQPMFDGTRGFLTGVPNLCFPSGHAALAFAVAASLAILFPRWRWVFYSVAAVTAAERFMEAAHWLSDVVFAAGFGVGCTHLIAWLILKRLTAGNNRQKAPDELVRQST
jgi:membrane-associated phospholipid phosphatase